MADFDAAAQLAVRKAAAKEFGTSYLYATISSIEEIDTGRSGRSRRLSLPGVAFEISFAVLAANAAGVKSAIDSLSSGGALALRSLTSTINTELQAAGVAAVAARVITVAPASRRDGVAAPNYVEAEEGGSRTATDSHAQAAATGRTVPSTNNVLPVVGAVIGATVLLAVLVLAQQRRSHVASQGQGRYAPSQLSHAANAASGSSPGGEPAVPAAPPARASPRVQPVLTLMQRRDSSTSAVVVAKAPGSIKGLIV